MKTDIHQLVTDRIIDLIESHKTELKNLWIKKDGSGSLPTNFKTKKYYSGVNILLLWGACLDNNFTSSHWLTFKQAQEIGGRVKKGSKGTGVVYYNVMKKELDSIQSVGEKTEVSIPFLKSFSVFNLDQIDGIEVHETVEERTEFDANKLAEEILKYSKADIKEEGNKAFFRRSTDEIYLPSRNSFISPSHFYSTALHELTHWTGHENRLNRQYGKRFGDNAYAFEELVAELGAAFLTSEIGVISQTIPDHAGYIESWLKVLKNDKKAIFTAASQASKAHSFIMNFLPDHKKELNEDIQEGSEFMVAA